MKNTILKFGAYSAIFLMVANLIQIAILGTDPENFGWGEIFGYSIIVASMVFVFMGIREYQIKTEKTGFWGALKIGTLITLFPSLVFGIYNIIYVTWIDPNFFSNFAE